MSEAAICLAAHLVETMPGVEIVYLALADDTRSCLRPVAAVACGGDLLGQRSVCVSMAAVSPAEEQLLLQAFREGQTIREASRASRRPGWVGQGIAIALPLRARNGIVGALLIQTAGPLEAEDAPLERMAAAMATLLHDLRREELFAGLERSKQHWEATFDSLSDLLYIHDAKGMLLKVNRALAERLGTTARDLMSSPHLFARHFASANCDGEGASPSTWRSETLGATFEVTRTPMYDRADRLIGCIHILRDITERLRLEAQMRQAEKLAALGEMLSGIAHELNNPLTSIVGYTERLGRNMPESDAPGNDSGAEAIQKIGREAARAARIVRNLLAFARPQALDQTALCLNTICRATAELCSDSLAVNAITLRLHLDDGILPILGNAHEIQQVLVNLITNALHAIREVRDTGCITIQTEAIRSGVRLIVADDGVGIRQENRGRLLDPFFTTKPVGEGTGLGLSICYGILRAHNAMLRIESDYGRGARFLMDFPALPAPQSAGLPAHSPVEARIFTARLPLLRVAVLDDEPLIRELLAEMLCEDGHRVDLFATPAAADEALVERFYDIILSDIKMPGMTGMQFYERVHARNPAQAARILFLTGDVLAFGSLAFFERTGCLYLNKPFRQEALKAQIANVLQRRSEADPAGPASAAGEAS